MKRRENSWNCMQRKKNIYLLALVLTENQIKENWPPRDLNAQIFSWMHSLVWIASLAQNALSPLVAFVTITKEITKFQNSILTSLFLECILLSCRMIIWFRFVVYNLLTLLWQKVCIQNFYLLVHGVPSGFFFYWLPCPHLPPEPKR